MPNKLEKLKCPLKKVDVVVLGLPCGIQKVGENLRISAELASKICFLVDLPETRELGGQYRKKIDMLPL